MCNCIQNMNDYLAPERQLSVVFQVTTGQVLGPLIETEWVNKPKSAKRNPPKLIATYCPFCGERIAPYADAPGADQSGDRK